MSIVCVQGDDSENSESLLFCKNIWRKNKYDKYVGISDTKRIALLIDISKDTDIKNLLKLHRNSISNIQKYIKKINKNPNKSSS